MSETINVRGPEYFREQAEREYLRQSVRLVEKKLEEQMEQSVPEAIDRMEETPMSETINVRDKSYFEELAERERVRRSIQVMERQMEEQMKKSIPDAIDNLLSGVFKNQKMEFEIKL